MAGNHSDMSTITREADARAYLLAAIKTYEVMAAHNQQRKTQHKEPAYTTARMTEQMAIVKQAEKRLEELQKRGQPQQHPSLAPAPFYVSPPPQEVQVPPSYMTLAQSPSPFGQPPQPLSSGYEPPHRLVYPYYGNGALPPEAASRLGQPFAYGPPAPSIAPSPDPAAPQQVDEAQQKRELIAHILSELRRYKQERLKEGPSFFGIDVESKCGAAARIIEQLENYLSNTAPTLDPTMTCQLFVPTGDEKELVICLHGKEMEALKEGRLGEIMKKYFYLRGNTWQLKPIALDEDPAARNEGPGGRW